MSINIGNNNQIENSTILEQHSEKAGRGVLKEVLIGVAIAVISGIILVLLGMG